LKNNDYGVYGANASPTFLNCEITDNLAYGIYLSGASYPTFGSSLSEWNDVYGNGPGDPDRDLCNGTEDIVAAYVYWGTLVESQIQARIHHEPDDIALGRVYFSPWTNAAHDTTYEGGITAVDPGPALPQAFALAQNRPNPFGSSTEIRYALPRDTQVRLDVFDVTGRRVETLVDGVEEAGFKVVRWDTRRVGSGVYFYRLQASEFTETRKMMSLK
jgi:parallel beta-helix repeat protein